MNIDDDIFPIFATSLGVFVVAIAAFSPPGEARTAAIALGSNLTGGGLVAYQTKIKYGGDDERDD